jgi:outer membrane immunogenic protein
VSERLIRQYGSRIGTQSRVDQRSSSGRAGFAWDRILFYGTFGDFRASSGSLPWTNSTQVGWTAGGGIEAALSPNWSVKVEYLYVDVGNISCPTGSCGAPTTVSLTENVIRAGINYKFGWGY